MSFQRNLIAASFGLLAAVPAFAQPADNTLRFAYGQALENPDPYLPRCVWA